MPVLIYIDHSEGKIRKSSVESICYGAALAAQLNTEANGIFIGSIDENELAQLGKYGVAKIYHAKNAGENAASLVKTLEEGAAKAQAEVIVFPFNQTAKTVAPALSVKLKAGPVTGAVELPDTSNGFVVKKAIFSGKAFARIRINSQVKIVCNHPNIFDIQEKNGVAEVVEIAAANVENAVKVIEQQKHTDKVSLTDAEIVVAGGMGLKGPDNWNLVTDLADALGGVAACSRPVADNGWRPHHEHVGQTGVQVSPNLYLAVGISGAIQHLGGVSSSKIIAAINKDPDAPIFKVADYGIVGDLSEILPQLTEAIKKAK